MAIAPLVAEIVIVGLEAAGWLTLLVLTIFGTNWVELGDLQDWSVLLTLLLIAIAYVLGILIDRIADSLFRQWLRRLSQDHLPDESMIRMTVLHTSPGMSGFLEYQRSRERIARATALNAVLAAGSGAAFLLDEVDAGLWTAAGCAAAALVIGGAALWAAVRIHQAREARLRDAYAVIEASRGTSEPATA